MRTLSATLLAAEAEATGEPYVHLEFRTEDQATVYDYSSDLERILTIEHHEEPYNDYAIIYLEDSGLDIPDLTGMWTEIGYGYVTDAGNEYSPTARLWVKSHTQVVQEGIRISVLELEGTWNHMSEQLIRPGDPPFYRANAVTGYYGDTKTVYWIIDDVLGAIDTTYLDFALIDIGEDDGIIDTFVPKFSVNDYQYFEDALTLIKRLIDMTCCYLRADANESDPTNMEYMFFSVKYPQESDAVDMTFYSWQEPYFYEWNYKQNIVVPNHIIIFANEGTDGKYADIITAEATIPAQIAKYHDVTRVETAAEITVQGDADNRATAIMSKLYAETASGRFIAPHKAGLQLYDRVALQVEV